MKPRGLSWSDFAVLFRSVSKDAGPLVEEMKRREIPYVIKGLTRLFDAPEVQACVQCFQYVMHQVTAEDLTDAWLAADLGLTRDDLARGIAVLDEARVWKPGERWGTYNIQRTYLRFLEELKIREETVPSADGTTRGELVFYNLGKFSQAISDFEQIYFQSEPQRKYEGVRELAGLPGPRVLRGKRRRRRVCDPRRGDDRHRPPGQGHAVASRVRPGAAQEPLPVPAPGRTQRLPRHPAGRRAGRRPVPGHRGRRDPPVLRRGHPGPEVPGAQLLTR